MYKRLLRRNRCIVVSDGYYEWRTEMDGNGKAAKQPFFISMPQGQTMMIAGLYDIWKSPEGSTPPKRACLLMFAKPM
jgi:putative SOS response-associated peptidase YedK